MKVKFVALLLCLLAMAVARPAAADQDAIGPIIAVAGQPIDLYFPNHVHPAPSVKVLQFSGDAQNFSPLDAVLGIHFDYIDQAGATVIVPLPNFYQNVVSGDGLLHHIEAGPVTLPFCPEQVSIHFENLTTGTEVNFQGVFDHTCIPVPEPSGLALLALGCMAFAGRRRP